MPLTETTAFRKDRSTPPTLMQHRHFATIAAIIAKLDDGMKFTVARHFADELAKTNPRFDRLRFVNAVLGDTSNG